MSEFVKGSEENSEEKILEFSRKVKYLAIVNEKTGEIESYIKLNEKNLGKDWVAMYQAMMLELAQLNLPNEQYRVFLALISKVDFDNYLRISQTEMAKELSMNRPNVARAIKGLCELNIIVEGPRAGLNKTYRLNPYIAHKGKDRKTTVVDFERTLTEQGKNITELVPEK